MFYYIRRKIAAKLACMILFIVTIISVIFTMYFNHINKKNLTEYLNISLSNAIHFADMGFAQTLWDYNEEEIDRLSLIILKNKLIIAVNVFDNNSFLTSNAKTFANNTQTEAYQITTLNTPYTIPANITYIKAISGNIVFKNKEVGKYEIFYTEEFINSAIKESNNRMLLAFIIIAALISVALMVGTAIINRPILELARVAKHIANDNDFSIEVKKSNRIDEVGILVNGFANMVEQLRQKEIEQNALYETLEKNFQRFNYLFLNLQSAIDSSDYSLRVKLESDNDELAISLNKVIQALEDADNTKQSQSWLKNGQAELGNIIGREQDIVKLSSKAIDFIASYIQVRVGTLFVKDIIHNDFRLVASYAFKTRKGISNRFKLGEGLTGQAALEKNRIIFTDVPEDYIKINSSLGEVTPKNIIVLPIIYEDDVKGVIELGSVSDFSPLQIEFLEIASEILAISINSAFFNEKLSLLLEQTREQAEELKAQQEELKATNEELEEQTQTLQAQKKEIEKSNNALKLKQMEIQKKADQLRIETQYKSEFLANMSHELRTPLNSLLILANVLAENEEENLTPDQIESATSIYRSGQNLLHLINNILDLSKIEARKIELNISRFPIKELCVNIKSEFLHMAKAKGIEFKVIMGGNIPEMITTDIQRLEQIIRNLIGNAIKFTETGSITVIFENIIEDNLNGQIKELTHERPLPQREPTIKADKTIAISVIDTGIGIPEEKLDAIFEAFKQVDGSIRRKHDGTGLGLSISKELAYMLGGEIRVKSKLGRGSTFTLYIPETLSESIKDKLKGITTDNNKTDLADKKDNFLDNTRSNMNNEKVRDHQTFLKDKKVLVVDDDMRNAFALNTFLKSKEMRVTIANNGKKALQLIENGEIPDIILMDIMMPVMDGYEAIRHIRDNRELKDIPIIALTAKAMSSDREECIRCGASDYLSKPLDTTKLLTLLRVWLYK